MERRRQRICRHRHIVQIRQTTAHAAVHHKRRRVDRRRIQRLDKRRAQRRIRRRIHPRRSRHQIGHPVGIGVGQREHVYNFHPIRIACSHRRSKPVRPPVNGHIAAGRTHFKRATSRGIVTNDRSHIVEGLARSGNRCAQSGNHSRAIYRRMYLIPLFYISGRNKSRIRALIDAQLYLRRICKRSESRDIAVYGDSDLS